MPLETDDLHQKAALWAKAGTDAFGRPTVSEPVEISCRWVTGLREGVNPLGQPVAYDGLVPVDRVIEIGSILRLGELVDVPDPPDELKEVIDYKETPDLKGREVRRVVKVMRYGGTLPTIV